MRKLLLVEDNEDNAFLIRTIISRSEFELIEATNGLQSIELAISEQPDLILMDIQLPDISGYEAVSQIRSALGDKVKIIAVTAYAMAGDREKCMEAGCDGYRFQPPNGKNRSRSMRDILLVTAAWAYVACYAFELYMRYFSQ